MIGQMGRKRPLRGIVLVFVFLISHHVWAQVGTITGRVTDAPGGVIPGVTITAANVNTGIKVTTVTNDVGLYVFPFLSPGNYQISAAMPGFKPLARSGIKLDVQQVARIDLALEIGAIDQEVTVVEKTPQLENETSSIGQVVENKTIVTLPLNGRSYSQLALLTPGTVPNLGSPVGDGFSVNGHRVLQNSFLVDGIDNNDYLLGFPDFTQAVRPSVDAVQEFKVETANYGAELGRAAGVISVALKSGTNAFHGSAFEFLRHDQLDANNFFSNRAGLMRPPLRYNQFGGTVGGPILRNRAFFFLSYQGTRNHQSDTVTVTVPTDLERQGDFSQTRNARGELIRIYDPLTTRPDPNRPGQFLRAPFLDGRIPVERMDPVGRRLAALYPAPNLPGTVNNYASNARNNDDSGQYDARLDYNIGTRDKLFLRYSRSVRDLVRGSVFGPPGNGGMSILQLPVRRSPRAYAVAVGETHIFSAALVNEWRAGYTRNESESASPAPRPLYEEFGIKGIPLFPGLTGLPQIVVTGFSVLGDRQVLPAQFRYRGLQLADTLSWVRGNHTLRLGGDLRLRKNYAASSNMARGFFTFTGQFTAPVAEQGPGSALADLLLGQTSSAQLTTLLLGDFRDHYYGFFINDTWRLSRKLTLNLGLRYELQTPMWERQNRMSIFNPDPHSPTFGQLAPARSGSIRARTFAELDKNNFAPRIGFAYQIGPKTVLRGAFGIFYGGLGYQAIVTSGAGNLPYFVNITLPSPTNSARSLLVLAEGFPAGALDPQQVRNPAAYALAADFHMPQTYQWNLSLQRELIGDAVLSLAYVGSGSLHLRGLNDINAPVPGPGPVNPRRPFPTFGIITFASSFVHATYHSMQAKVAKRFGQGFSLLSSYTWSHAIDNSTDPEDGTSSPRMPQNPNNTRAEAGSSIIDVRHRLTSSVIYDLPVGRRDGWMGNARLIRALLGGWQLGGIFVAQGGRPLSPAVSPNPANTTTPARPDRISDGSLSRSARSVDRWFDSAAFIPAARFTFGNSGRNVLRAPGLVNLDLLLARNFQITEAKRLELRGEFFNLTNSVHFGQPGLIINQPQAGRITSTLMPNRQVQIGLRFVF